jgi:CBS domain containing-hemolysin-like protein
MNAIEAADRPRRKRACRAARQAVAALALGAGSAHASLFQGETLDKVADVMAWVVLAIVPIIVIVVFWIIHVMPEKIAEKRHHPQSKAIQCLCLLSLVFGGLLWPIAWLWAYTRPVAYKLAYGTDKHEHYFVELGEKVRSGTADERELAELKRELDEMHARGALPEELAKLRDDITAYQSATPAKVLPASAELERRSA